MSLEFLKKSAYTGSHQGMRYRLEQIARDGDKVLKTVVWPEPFNYLKTPDEEKETAEFPFTEEGMEEAVAWMNGRLSEEREKWEHSSERWTDYRME